MNRYAAAPIELAPNAAGAEIPRRSRKKSNLGDSKGLLALGGDELQQGVLMPFDGLTFAPQEKLPIAASRASLEIADLVLLEHHKSAEVKRHAPGWAYRHQAALQIAFGLSVVASFVGFLVLEAQGFAAPAFAMAAILCALIAVALKIPMRGPARWEERDEPDLASVHPRVAEAACALRAQLPDVQFRIGELFQEKVKLDPYLVAEHGGARLLLGIWDGEDVVFCA